MKPARCVAAVELLVVILTTTLLADATRASPRCPGIDFSTFDTAPVLVERAAPNQEGAWDTGFSGPVSVEVFVLSTGKVCDARLVEPTGNGFVAAAARTAARQSRYAPALRDGEPVAGIARVTIEFDSPRLRTEPPVLDTRPPMISELAEVTAPAEIAMGDGVAPGCDVEIPAFTYEGVTFVGDISRKDYEALRELLVEYIDADQVVRRVHHHLVYPERCRSREPVYWGQRPDVSVEVGRSDESHAAMAGRVATYHFLNVGGEYRLLPLVSRDAGPPPERD